MSEKPIVLKMSSAARMLDMDRRKLMRLADEGQIRSFREGGNRYVRMIDLEAWVNRKLELRG